MVELPSIPDFFRNKNVFITGGSGFIGKVLVEKLLRSCPAIKTIYLLMRPKKGKSLEERIKIITELPLFDILKHQNPDALKKIRLINGDVTELSLGLSAEDQKLLIEETDVVFHGAASVRFDDLLTDAVILNTRGTREVVKLALEMKNLAVLVHISTTYCNTDRQTVEEKLYPPHADWEKTIEIAENVDKDTLNILTKKYIQPLPNTYTFTKSLGEHVVYDLGNKKIPLVIFRPSIVISTFDDPVSGWIDNFNGPIGLMVGSGKGVVRTVYGDPEVIADYVPVDLIVKAIIMSSWKKAITKDPSERLETSFYNGSSNDVNPVTMGQVVSFGKTICEQVPLNNILWYPNGSVTKCYYYHFLKLIFYHMIPALMVDGLLKVMGRKPMLTKIQRRIYLANMAVSYFLHNQWQFINHKIIALEDELLPNDVEAFGFRKDELEVLEYFTKAGLGARKYLLKEDDDSLEQAKKNMSRMWVLAQIVNFLWYAALIWIIFVKIDIISVIINKYNDICLYFTTD